MDILTVTTITMYIIPTDIFSILFFLFSSPNISDSDEAYSVGSGGYIGRNYDLVYDDSYGTLSGDSR